MATDSSFAERPVCVLSAGRSGTSVLARALNILGLNLGPEDAMLPANDHNVRGYWEQAAVVALNDDLLRRLGGTLWELPSVSQGWEADPGLQEVRERARRIVRETFAADRRWAFKDPRTAFTWPLWRHIVGEMELLVCVRRCDEVVRSMQKASGMPTVVLDQCWLELNAHILGHLVGRRRTFVFFDEWFADPVAVSRRVARHVFGDRHHWDPETWQEIQQFFDPSLRHFGDEEDASPPEAQAMLALLQLAAEAPADPGHDARRHRIAVELARAHRARQELRHDLRTNGQRLDDPHRDSRELAQRHDAVLERALRAERINAQLMDSVSWRLTTPLRVAKARVLHRR
jgi:hypothetical protein